MCPPDSGAKMEEDGSEEWLVSVLAFQKTCAGERERRGHTVGREFCGLFVCRFVEGDFLFVGFCRGC